MLLVWEEHAARAVVKARRIARMEQARLIRTGLDEHGLGLRVDEIDVVCDLCNELLGHIDPHVVSEWHEDTPLP